jgi:transposase
MPVGVRARGYEWVGYKVHFTETCDQDTPHLITHVETTGAATPDDGMLEPIHAALAKRDLLPQIHLVDAGYTDAALLVSSQRDYAVSVLGPVACDPSWQAKAAEGFDKGSFIVDWDAQTVTCPAGKQNYSWLPHEDKSHALSNSIRVQFSSRDCTPCPFRSRCTRAKMAPRELTLQSRDEYEALHRVKQLQTTAEFRSQYALRAGIEGTHSQGIRRTHLRQARYRSFEKTHLQHVITATALNLLRAGEWFAQTPHAKTRVSPFSSLQAAHA